jgi:hypothetical protein
MPSNLLLVITEMMFSLKHKKIFKLLSLISELCLTLFSLAKQRSEIEPLPSFVSGKAIKYVRDTLFTAESGTRRGVPKVIVVITDGRSQDDVTKISREMQSDGKC